MSSDTADSEQHLNSKGKARALLPEPTEDTPLLASSSASVTSHEHPQDPPYARRLCSRLLTIFLVSLSFCILALLVVVLAVYSYRSRASGVSPEEIIQRALVVKGPDWINVLNTTDDGAVWIEVHGRVGVDAGGVVGVNTDEKDGLFQYWWKSIGRWGIHQLDRVTVNVTTIVVTSEYNSSDVLASISVSPLELPLTANPPRDTSWLTPVSIPLLIKPTHDVGALLRFVRNSWKQGKIDVRTSVDNAQIWGGGVNDKGWRRAFNMKHSNIQTEVRIRLPTVPGAPPSGDHSPLPVFSKVVQLQSFAVVSSNESLLVHANATVINPTPLVINFNFTAPPLPFTLALPPPFNSKHNVSAPIPIVDINTQPFTFAHPNTTVPVIGSVLPLGSNASSALSALLKNYVSGNDSDIVLTSPLLPNVTIDTTFPGANPKPRILRNVTLKDMKIKIEGTAFLASGFVNARVVLPRGINVALDVSQILPDVLVFDGGVPPDEPTNGTDSTDVPPAPPLPDPLPEKAIAHLRPEEWLDAHSELVDGDEGDGTTVAVTARIEDAPVEVLPGREREFSDFVGKVIFGKQPALAGVKGTVAVRVTVHGLPLEDGQGEMELSGLPFQGNVRIGKPRGMLDDGSD